MKPHVICHMMSSINGRLGLDRWTRSLDGDRSDWSAAYAEIHDALAVDGWIVGRVTMAEMAKGEPHPPSDFDTPARPVHVANPDARAFAVALDRSGRLHFKSGGIEGDHVVVMLGSDVPDAHLVELAGDGVSYIVADGSAFELAALLDMLGRSFGVRRLALEGGGGINGSFFAAGLVDELSVIVVPAVDGGAGSRGIFENGDDGLAGIVELALASYAALRSGAVHLRYAVTSRAGAG